LWIDGKWDVHIFSFRYFSYLGMNEIVLSSPTEIYGTSPAISGVRGILYYFLLHVCYSFDIQTYVIQYIYFLECMSLIKLKYTLLQLKNIDLHIMWHYMSVIITFHWYFISINNFYDLNYTVEVMIYNKSWNKAFLKFLFESL
jgi:hypothetical protein